MKIIVKVKTGAKKVGVERLEQPTLDFGGSKTEMVVYKVSVKERPIHGMANEAIVRALSDYFGVAKSQVRLVIGQTSKQKIFNIDS